MSYRCVKDNNTNEVIAIGMDESQGGQNYNDIGTWEDFTFDIIPIPEGALLSYIDAYNYTGSILKVVGNEVVLKTIEEL